MPPLFFPPRPSTALIWLTHRLGTILAKVLYNLSFEVVEADLDLIRPLKRQRVIYMVNHPTFNDPIPVMLLSARVRKGFYYLASIEQFAGILGWYFQRIGTYSVRRGQRDRSSMKQTLELLSQPGTHLVIFAEGGCSFQNDTVMPFRPGAIQLGLQAMQRAVKQGKDLYDCYVVPLGLKYRYSQNPEPLIEQSLERLEAELSLSPQAQASEYERLRAIAGQVLRQIETDYGLNKAIEEENLTPRIDALRQRILQECEAALEIEGNIQASPRERAYQIEAKIADEACEPKQLSRDLIERSVFRLFNFSAIYDGYVAENRTPERFLETLTRLEREVFQVDRPPSKGPRVAKVGVGQPLNLKDEYANYLRDRGGTVERLTLQIQDQVQFQVDRLSQ